jgi:hypothetical protein
MFNVVEKLNDRFNSQRITGVNPELLADGQSLPNALQQIGLIGQGPNPFADWPSTVLESIRAGLYNAVTRSLAAEDEDERVPVQFGWSEGVGYAAEIWEAESQNGSLTVITMELVGPE